MSHCHRMANGDTTAVALDSPEREPALFAAEVCSSNASAKSGMPLLRIRDS